jgi:hypothetical protein
MLSCMHGQTLAHGLFCPGRHSVPQIGRQGYGSKERRDQRKDACVIVDIGKEQSQKYPIADARDAAQGHLHRATGRIVTQ